MNESLPLKFLYQTIPGRNILKFLVNPSVSEFSAQYFSSSASRWLIDYYIKKYNIDLKDCEKQEFSSFNDFFKRKKNITINKKENEMISPCDSFLSIYKITDDLHLKIKHSRYTLGDILKDNKLASEFSGGICCVFRLEPHHYHRYIYAADGRIKRTANIKGILHCVRPVACQEYPVYIQNSRQYTLTHNRIFGDIIQMEIGALLVGKIQNHPFTTFVNCGTEKGYFEYGGSTIILIFQENSFKLLPCFSKILNTETEIPVSIGQVIGKKF